MAYGFDNKVDAALVNGGSIRLDDELKGDITAIDIFRTLPFGGGILKVDLKGSLLTKVLKYGKLKAGSGPYLQRHLITQNEKGEWLINEKPIEPNKTYTVAFTDYLLTGADIPFLNKNNKEVLKVYTNKPESMAIDIRKCVVNYLKTLKK